MVRLRRGKDTRFRLPADDFAPNDLVLAFAPPPARVYNPCNQSPAVESPSWSSSASAHDDHIHFGRMRKWLIQSYPHVSWTFKGYDDFYPRDQTPGQAPDMADPAVRAAVFVNNVYGMYEVAHWHNADRQMALSKRLLRLLGSGGDDDDDDDDDDDEHDQEYDGDDEMDEPADATDDDLSPFFGTPRGADTHGGGQAEADQPARRPAGSITTGAAAGHDGHQRDTQSPDPIAVVTTTPKTRTGRPASSPHPDEPARKKAKRGPQRLTIQQAGMTVQQAGMIIQQPAVP